MKAHPDKGGRKEDLQKLQAAKEEWQKVRKDAAPKAGRPFFDAEPSTAEDGTLACARQRKRKETERLEAEQERKRLREQIAADRLKRRSW